MGDIHGVIATDRTWERNFVGHKSSVWTGTVAPLTPDKLDLIARNRATALARHAQTKTGCCSRIAAVRWSFARACCCSWFEGQRAPYISLNTNMHNLWVAIANIYIYIYINRLAGSCP